MIYIFLLFLALGRISPREHLVEISPAARWSLGLSLHVTNLTTRCSVSPLYIWWQLSAPSSKTNTSNHAPGDLSHPNNQGNWLLKGGEMVLPGIPASWPNQWKFLQDYKGTSSFHCIHTWKPNLPPVVHLVLGKLAWTDDTQFFCTSSSYSIVIQLLLQSKISVDCNKSFALIIESLMSIQSDCVRLWMPHAKELFVRHSHLNLTGLVNKRKRVFIAERLIFM